MKKTLFFFCITLLLSIAAQAQDKIEISLKNNSQSEIQTKEQLQRLLKTYDLSKWIFTKSVVIEENVIPHSHPVLTLSTRHIKDDELLLFDLCSRTNPLAFSAERQRHRSGSQRNPRNVSQSSGKAARRRER